jgi:hypothetical protein
LHFCSQLVYIPCTDAYSCFYTFHWCLHLFFLYLARMLTAVFIPVQNEANCLFTLHWCFQLFLYLCYDAANCLYTLHGCSQLFLCLALMQPAVFIPCTKADLALMQPAVLYFALMQPAVFMPCADAASCFYTLH